MAKPKVDQKAQGSSVCAWGVRALKLSYLGGYPWTREREEGGRGKEKKRGWPRERRREINPLPPFGASAPGDKSILSLFVIFFVA